MTENPGDGGRPRSDPSAEPSAAPPPGWESQTTEFAALPPPGLGQAPEHTAEWGDPATPYVIPQSGTRYGAQYGSHPTAPMPYPLPPYPSQPYSSQPYGYPPGSTAPQPSAVSAERHRRWPWAALAVVVAGALVLTGFLVAGGGSAGSPTATPSRRAAAARTLTLPASAAGFTRDTSGSANSMLDMLGSVLGRFGASGSAALRTAKVGTYAQNGGNAQMIFLGLPVKSTPSLRRKLAAGGPAAVVQQSLAQVAASFGGGTPRSFAPGSLGGAMGCTSTDAAGQTIGLCAWCDTTYFGESVIVLGQSMEWTARVTREFREAAEH